MSTFWLHTKDLEAPALVKGQGEAVSYAELYAAADAFAACLQHRSLVFIRAGNNVETVSAYLGCLRHNHVCLIISRDLGADMLSRLAETYMPDYIYGPGEDGAYRLEAKEGSPLPLHPDLSVLLSTSGSTGSPKLVRLTAANMQANAASIAEYLQLTPQERPITVLPFYYAYGLSVLNSHLCAGAALLLTEESIINPAFWNLFDSCGATSLAGVPYTYDMLEAIGFRKRSLPTLRSMTQSGARMAPEMVLTYAKWAQERGIRFFKMYGQTEATSRMSYLPPHLVHDHPDAIGIAIPNGRFYLEHTDAKGEGELMYSGPNVSMGYAQTRADLALGDVNKGVVNTGDLAVCEEGGIYRIVGRKKRFLKIAGNRFSLDELDFLFRRQGIEAVCGGADDKLEVVITDASQKSAAAAYLKDTWHLMRTQFKIRVVERIPRSATGKVLYGELFG